MSQWMLFFLSLTELALLFLVVLFFWRLRRSEALLNELQRNQENLLSKLHFNAELEQELIMSFEERQRELADVDEQIQGRIEELKELMRQAEKISRSPQTMRQIIINGRRRGQSVKALAHSTGLSVDEVELILMETGKG